MSKREKPKYQRKQSKPAWQIVALFSLVILALGGVWLLKQDTAGQEIYVSGNLITETQLTQGEQLYETNCASCHGLQGEGQVVAVENNLLAPPHNSTGHTWHHSDEQLLAVIAFGGNLADSPMPAYNDLLTSNEMENVLAYIKTFWMPAERRMQSQQGG